MRAPAAAAILLAALGAAGAGCAIPRSELTRIAVSGTLVTAEGEPLPGEVVQVGLPAEYGLRGPERALGSPEDYGHGDQVLHATTDGEGRFEILFEPVPWPVTSWVLPPLGTAFQHPPDPSVTVRVQFVDPAWFTVQARGDDLRVRGYDFRTMEPLQRKPLLRVTGRSAVEDLPGPDGESLRGFRITLRLERTSGP